MTQFFPSPESFGTLRNSSPSFEEYDVAIDN